MYKIREGYSEMLNIFQEDLEGKKIPKTNKNTVKANPSNPFHYSISMQTALFVRVSTLRKATVYFDGLEYCMSNIVGSTDQ